MAVPNKRLGSRSAQQTDLERELIMKILILICCWLTLIVAGTRAENIPAEIDDLIIGEYVAQNDAQMMMVHVKAGDKCTLYSQGTSIKILETVNATPCVERNMPE